MNTELLGAKKITLVTLASVLLLSACNKNKSSASNNPQKLNQNAPFADTSALRRDFAVSPAFSKVFTAARSAAFEVAELNYKTPSEIHFSLPQKPSAYQVEIIEGDGTYNRRTATYEPGTKPGTTILKFTDKDNRVSHAVISVIEKLQLLVGQPSASPYEASPCQQLNMIAEGGFAPYRFEVSKNASILENPLRLRFPDSYENFVVKVIDAQGNEIALPLKASLKPQNREAADFCFGDNGKISFPSNGITDKSSGKSFSDFVAKKTAITDQGEIYIAGLQVLNNNFAGLNENFRYLSLETLRETHQMKWAIRAYLKDGSPNTSFGENGILISPSARQEVTSPEAILVQPDGKILLASVSYSNEGMRYTLTRLLANGKLDVSFGDSGEVVSEIHPKKPDLVAQAALGQMMFPTPSLNVKKILWQNFQGQSRIIIATTFTSPSRRGYFAHEETLQVRSFLTTGKPDFNFGDQAKIDIISPRYGITEQTDIALSADQGLYILVPPSDGILAHVQKYLPSGKLDLNFGDQGSLLFKDPHWQSHHDNSRQPFKPHALNGSNLKDDDIYNQLRFFGIKPNPKGFSLVGSSSLLNPNRSHAVICSVSEFDTLLGYQCEWSISPEMSSVLRQKNFVDAPVIKVQSSSYQTEDYNAQRLTVIENISRQDLSEYGFTIQHTTIAFDKNQKNKISVESVSDRLSGGQKQDTLQEIVIKSANNTYKTYILTTSGLYLY